MVNSLLVNPALRLILYCIALTRTACGRRLAINWQAGAVACQPIANRPPHNFAPEKRGG